MNTNGLRVIEVERAVVRVPLTERNQLWNGTRARAWELIEVVKLTANATGLAGFGETMLHYTRDVTDEEVAAVQGANPADCLGDDRFSPAVQMALYDLVGKALGVPASRLFGPPKIRQRCELSWWTTGMPADAVREEAVDAVAAGYLSHKLKARPWFDVFEQMEQVASVTPERYRMDLDFNATLLDSTTALGVLSELDQDPRIGIYESPVRYGDLEGSRRLRGRVRHPIAEHLGEVGRSAAALTGESFDGFVLEGGVRRIMDGATVAHAFNKACWVQLVGTGLTTALALQLSSVLPAARWPAVTCLNVFTDDLVTEPIRVVDGSADVPEAPGLGVVCDESAVARMAVEPPHRVEHPQAVWTVQWPSRRRRHYASREQLTVEFADGNFDVAERGLTTTVDVDDGSAEFADLHRRARIRPVDGE
jgi:L-alanine-DL-glutamate epimerase-like enolase superfamily enzyme